MSDDGRDILDAMDVLVNADAVVVLRDTTFSAHVLITSVCIVQDCIFPFGLTIRPGGSVQFQGHNKLKYAGNWITIDHGAMYVPLTSGGHDAVLA